MDSLLLVWAHSPSRFQCIEYTNLFIHRWAMSTSLNQVQPRSISPSPRPSFSCMDCQSTVKPLRKQTLTYSYQIPSFPNSIFSIPSSLSNQYSSFHEVQLFGNLLYELFTLETIYDAVKKQLVFMFILFWSLLEECNRRLLISICSFLYDHIFDPHPL